MNLEAHPETDQLVAYSEQPESVQHQTVGLHLAVCEQCRKDLQALSSLRQHAGWISADMTESSDEMHGDVSDLLHDRLSGQAVAGLRDRIKQNPVLLREALHHARHHVAMQHRVRAAEISQKSYSMLQHVKDLIVRFFQIETPVWKLMPLAVVLVAIVSVFSSLLNPQQNLQVAKLVRFDDQPAIQFVAQESQPGIGFFANAKQTSIAFDGVSVQMKNDREIVFSWPEIKGAINYRLKLQVFRNGATVVLGRITGDKPEGIIKLAEPPGQHRYEWVITGDTIDKRSFQTTGGFVVMQ